MIQSLRKSQKKRLIILEPHRFPVDSEEEISKYFEVEKGPLSRRELITEVYKYDGIITRLGHRIDSEVIECGSRLQFLASATTGLTHFDLEACARREIRIISLKDDYNFLSEITSTAELTFGLMLALSRNLIPAAIETSQAIWNRDNNIGHTLSNKVLGIVGLGRLGKMVAEYGKAFNMKVIATESADVDYHGVPILPIREIFSSSDFISIHLPANSSTRDIVNKQLIALMKETAYLINTSRGEVLDENALLESLMAQRIGGAALDVLKGEYLPEHRSLMMKLFDYSAENRNLIMTPHIGGATYDDMFIAEKRLTEKILSSVKEIWG